MRKTNPTIVSIKWRDACQQEAASPATPLGPAASRLAVLHEVGWLIGEDDESVSISMELEQDGMEPGRWRLHIPKAAIVERRDFKQPRLRQGAPHGS